jgi:radical SAM superfamily enzyme YgiQ (UPF0313 family)
LGELYHHRIFIPSPAASIEALKRSIKDTQLKFVTIHDDILTLNKDWFYGFIEKYANDIRLPFVCNLRIGSFDEKDVRLLKTANIQSAWIGIESGNDYIRNEIMHKNISREQIIDSIDLLHRYKVGVNTQNIIGAPHETGERFLDTVRINAECWPAEKFFLSIFYPYPKTTLFDLCVREHLLTKQTNTVTERVSPVLDLPYFPSKEILFYFRNFNYLVKYQYLRLKYHLLLFLPLTVRTSFIISFLMRCLDTPRIIIKIVRYILPLRFKWWLKRKVINICPIQFTR